MKLRGMLTFNKEADTIFQCFSGWAAQRGCTLTVCCFVGFKGMSVCFGFFIDHFGNANAPQTMGQYSSFQYFVKMLN